MSLVNSNVDELISVVVPFYGGEEFVEACVDSILAQTYRNLQVILVDDGSPDRTGEICDRYARQDSRIQVIHQENAGLVQARKAGVKVATGTYLSFVDGDDWIGPTYLQDMHGLMSSSAADLVVSGYVREFMGRLQSVPPRIAPGNYDRTAIVHDILPVAVFNGVFFQHGISTYVWNKMFRLRSATSLLLQIPDQILMGEDAALTYPYLAQSSRLAVSAGGTYFYRQRPRSILKSIPSVEVEYSRLSALVEYLMSCFDSTPTSAQLLEQLRQYFFALVLTRSGGIVQSSDGPTWFSPYPGLAAGQRLVIYSSGSFGQHVVAALERLGAFQIVGWIDEDADESQRIGLQVSPVDSITSLEFDLVLIASIDSEYSREVATQLERLGVERQKISQLALDQPRLEASLSAAGFDLESYAFTPARNRMRHTHD